MIAVVLRPSDARALVASVAALAQRPPRGVGLLEVRLDHLRGLLPDGLLGELPLPVIATCRRVADGGAFDGSEDERLALLASAAGGGAAWVDVEDDVDPLPDGLREVQRVESFHIGDGPPSDLDARIARAFGRGAACVKAAVRVRSLADLSELTRAARGAAGPVVAVGLGAAGLAGRVLYRRVGSPWTYAALEPHAGDAATGLPSLAELAERHCAGEEPDLVLGVLSDRAQDSIGPAVYGPLLRAWGRHAVYLPFTTADLEGLRAFLETFDVAGLAVTTPFKQDVVRLADTALEPVPAIGAANTLFWRDGRLVAANTDVDGVLDPLARLGMAEGGGRPALVLGAGGAGRAAAWALSQAGFDVGIWSRRRARAEEAARDLGVAAREPGGDRPAVLVNATPAGGPRAPDALPADPLSPGPGQVVLEMNYRRGDTPLLARARSAGARLVTGAEVFAAQGWRQLRVFLGRVPGDPLVLERAVERELEARERAAHA